MKIATWISSNNKIIYVDQKRCLSSVWVTLNYMNFSLQIKFGFQYVLLSREICQSVHESQRSNWHIFLSFYLFCTCQWRADNFLLFFAFDILWCWRSQSESLPTPSKSPERNLGLSCLFTSFFHLGLLESHEFPFPDESTFQTILWNFLYSLDIENNQGM